MMLEVKPKASSELGKHMPGPRVAFKPKVLETGSKGKLYEVDLGDSGVFKCIKSTLWPSILHPRIWSSFLVGMGPTMRM